MLPHRILEYLFYLCIVILLFKFSESATINHNSLDNNIVITHTTNTATATPATSTTDAAAAAAANASGATFDKRDAMKRAFDECASQFSWMCLKIEFVKLMERLAEQEELNLVPGVSVVRNANANVTRAADLMAEVARSYPNDPSSRLNGYLLAKFSNFLQTRHLSFKLIDDSTAAEARSAVATGRKGKFGKKGGLEALLAAGLMMKGTLMAIGMGAIALMAGKALMTALMALTLSGVLGLKSLAGGGGKSTTYEIVAKPIYTSSHSHSVSHDDGHGHYGGGGGGGAGHSGSGYGGYSRSLKLELPNHLKQVNNL